MAEGQGVGAEEGENVGLPLGLLLGSCDGVEVGC